MMQELERGDSGIRSFASVQSGLVMYPIHAFGSEEQKDYWLPKLARAEKIGCFGLTEPDHGSNPSGMVTNFKDMGDHYLLNGAKMWISGGDHDLTPNVVHLVLARIEGAPPGVKGISLFIVPKKLVDEQGRLTGERNDVALAGLNHKCGYRGTVNTLLNFGEGKFPVHGQSGAVGSCAIWRAWTSGMLPSPIRVMRPTASAPRRPFTCWDSCRARRADRCARDTRSRLRARNAGSSHRCRTARAAPAASPPRPRS